MKGKEGLTWNYFFSNLKWILKLSIPFNGHIIVATWSYTNVNQEKEQKSKRNLLDQIKKNNLVWRKYLRLCLKKVIKSLFEQRTGNNTLKIIILQFIDILHAKCVQTNSLVIEQKKKNYNMCGAFTMRQHSMSLFTYGLLSIYPKHLTQIISKP